MAMIVGKDMVGESGSSVSVNHVESRHNSGELSPEDITWADSLLIDDAEISQTNWTSMMGALAEALSSHSDPLDTLTTEGDVLSGLDTKMSLASLESKPSENLDNIVHDFESIQINEASEKNNDEHLMDEKINTLKPRTKYSNVFRPTYKEDVVGIDNSDLDADVDSIFPALEVEPTAEDIFKVWDLNIPVEEDELAKQLEKALRIDIRGNLDLSLDDLATAISDLSLSEKSG